MTWFESRLLLGTITSAKHLKCYDCARARADPANNANQPADVHCIPPDVNGPLDEQNQSGNKVIHDILQTETRDPRLGRR